MIYVENLQKTFGQNKGLDGVTLRIHEGEMVALIGSSGSGKSTLMRHLAGLSAADSTANIISINNHIVQQNGKINHSIRRIRSEIGMIFQQFNLVGRMSVLQNVCLGSLSRTPTWRSLTGFFYHSDKELAYTALARVGILEKALERTSNLSGGQQQRAAIARALVQKAQVLLADEPIASLDPESSRTVMELLRELNHKDNLTVLVSLHQVDYAIKYCPRTIALKHGRVVYDGLSANLTPEFLTQLYGEESAELFAPAEQTEHEAQNISLFASAA